MNAANEFGPMLDGQKHIFADEQSSFRKFSGEGGQFQTGRDMLCKGWQKTLVKINGRQAYEAILCTGSDDSPIMKGTVHFHKHTYLTNSGNVAVDSTAVLASLTKPRKVAPSNRNAAPSAKGTASKNWKATSLHKKEYHKLRVRATCLLIWSPASKICQVFASMQAVGL